MRVYLIASLCVRRVGLALLLFLTCWCIPGISATLAYQDFGQSSIGIQTDQTINVTAVNPGPAAISLQYSIDFSVGACVPNGNGCSLPVSFIPTKPGLRQDAVIVKDANGQVIEEVLLSGTGMGPLPVFSPALATWKLAVTESIGAGSRQAIAATPDGKIVMIANNTISRFDPATNNLTTVLNATANPITPSLPSINGLAVDASGGIYYANVDSELRRIDSVTQVDSVVASNVNTSNLAVAPSGTIVYSQGNQIFEIAANTSTPVLVAGNGTGGFTGDNGPAVQAELNSPEALALDLAGNLYFADLLNQRVRKISASGTISTIAGTGTASNSGDGGLATSASLNGPVALTVDAAGDVYVATALGLTRRIDSGTGLISTVAGANTSLNGGNSASNPFVTVGSIGSSQYVGSLFSYLALDASGNLWVGTASTNQQSLFEVSTSALPLQFPFTALGQSQTQSVSLLNAGTASLTQPTLATTGQAASAFSPSSNCPTTLGAGSTCALSVTFTAAANAAPTANVTVNDNAVSSPQTIGVSGVSGGFAPAAQQIASVAVGSSSATPQAVSVQFPGNASGLTATLAYGVEFSLGTVSCSGTSTVSCTVPVTFSPLYPGLRTDTIRFVDSTGAVVYQCFLSGTGQGPQWLVDLGAVGSITVPSTSIALGAIDVAGNLFAVARYAPGRVYKFSKQTSQWSLIAGQSTSAPDGGDGGPASAASLSSANAVMLDSAGNIFIAETFTVRRIDAQSGVITTVAQEGGTSLAVDQSGYLYIGNPSTNKVRRLQLSSGTIVTFAGNGQYASTGDGGLATAAALYSPGALAFDGNGNLLISELYRIRKVDMSSGIITTYGSSCNANSIAMDPAGNLYLPCGGISVIPAGGGASRSIETSLTTVSGLLLRGADGTFYNSNGTVLSPTFPNPLSLSALVGRSYTSSTTLTNVGNNAMTISSIALSGTNASAFSQTNTCGQSLASNQNCTLTISFAASQTALQTANLAILSNAASLQTTLNGTGFQTSISILPQTLAFGNVSTASRVTQTITIQNVGSYQFAVSGVFVSGPNASDFAPFSACSSTPTYVSFCTIYVGFLPGAVGPRTATLTITDDAAGSPHTVPLTGTGYSLNAGSFDLPQGNAINFGSSNLVMQSDGNLVLYQGSTPLWNTGTGGQNCSSNQCQLIFQADGNLVIYNGSTPIWSSGTYGNPGARLVYSMVVPYLQIVSANGSVLWTAVPQFYSGTFTLTQGTSLNIGAGSLIMQGDGNLVLYQNGSPVWSTGTYGQNCGSNQCSAIFQSDGNLVVYNGSAVLWSSATYGNSGSHLVYSATAPYLQISTYNMTVIWTAVPAFQSGNLTLAQGASIKFGSSSLVMQSDGNLVLYRVGIAPWSSGTYGQSCGTNQCQAIFQGDGNLVVYNGSTALWNSGTYGHPGAQLTYSSSTSQLEIVGSDQSVLWAR